MQTSRGKIDKPLGRKNYGSIGHFAGSRTSEGDFHVGEAQCKLLTDKTRDRYDLIIVQEKLDGSNVGVTPTRRLRKPTPTSWIRSMSISVFTAIRNGLTTMWGVRSEIGWGTVIIIDTVVVLFLLANLIWPWLIGWFLIKWMEI